MPPSDNDKLRRWKRFSLQQQHRRISTEQRFSESEREILWEKLSHWKSSEGKKASRKYLMSHKTKHSAPHYALHRQANKIPISSPKLPVKIIKLD